MVDPAMVANRVKLGIDEHGLCSQPEHLDKRDSFMAATALERRDARNLCGTLGQENACPVRETCLKWALENKAVWGVWGGCDESELRRALWVDAQGHSKPRCRFPNCPNCKSRPNKLRIIQELDSSVPTVHCVACNFSWRSRTSALAVKAYQRTRDRKVRVPRRRVVDQPVGKPVRALPVAVQAPDDDVLPLVASAQPSGTTLPASQTPSSSTS
jgi:Zn ribbon nucleic-acid-binding protein